MEDRPRVVRNDWSPVDVPDIGAWRPDLTVSVVIPAHECQETLNLTLASLSRQTYPAALLDVVVVDDGSEPPLELGEIRPANTRIVRAPDHAKDWGIAAAVNAGVEASSGALVQRLDADLVVFPEHVEAHARWHHRIPYAVTLGSKLFVDVAPGTARLPSPAAVADACSAGATATLFDEGGAEQHAYVERLLRRSDNLRDADHLGFLVHVGATVALRRELFDLAGQMDSRLKRGSDTEFGYRLAQAGALFVPEPSARSWHLGRSHMMLDGKAIQRYARPFLADAMPHPRWLRTVGGSAWSVPLVTAVVAVDDHPLELVRAAVDAILRSDETDLRLVLVGAWDSIGDARQPLLRDPTGELRLIRETYRSDPRVRLADRAPETVFPSPYLLTVPPTVGLAPSAIGRLIEFADRHRAGAVQVSVPGGRGAAVTLWRTAARSRASWVAGTPSRDAVADVYGVRTLSAGALGAVDLSGHDSASAAGVAAARGVRARWRAGGHVEVAGARSLMRAALFVAGLAAARVRARLGRLAAFGGARGAGR